MTRILTVIPQRLVRNEIAISQAMRDFQAVRGTPERLKSLALVLVLLFLLFPTDSLPMASAATITPENNLYGSFNPFTGEVTFNHVKPDGDKELEKTKIWQTSASTTMYIAAGSRITEVFEETKKTDSVTVSAGAPIKALKAGISTEYSKIQGTSLNDSTDELHYRLNVEHICGQYSVLDFEGKTTQALLQDAFDREFFHELYYGQETENFFKRYGYFIITGYQAGGALNYTHSALKTSGVIEQTVKDAFKGAVDVSGPFGLSAKSAYALEQELKIKSLTTDLKTQTLSKITGGVNKISFSNDPSNMQALYNEWLASFTPANSVMLVNAGLKVIPLWELLPEGFEARAKQLEYAYTKRSIETDLEFNKDFIYRTGGYGTEIEVFMDDKQPEKRNGVIEIFNAEDFSKIGQSATHPLDATYVQMADIDLGGTPLGLTGKEFTGVYDGDGRVISRYGDIMRDFDSSASVSAGLFTINRGTIRNVMIKQATVIYDNSGGSDVNVSNPVYQAGIISGINYGTIENVHVLDSTVSLVLKTSGRKGNKSYAYAGGIVGKNHGTIRSCSFENTGKTGVFSKGQMYTASNDSQNYAVGGGICGQLQNGTISDCYTSTNVRSDVYSAHWTTYFQAWPIKYYHTPSLYSYAGGIAGEVSDAVSQITRGFSTGSQSGSFTAKHGQNGQTDSKHANKTGFYGQIIGRNSSESTMNNCIFKFGGQPAAGSGNNSGATGMANYQSAAESYAETGYWLSSTDAGHPVLPFPSPIYNSPAFFVTLTGKELTVGDVITNPEEYFLIYYTTARFTESTSRATNVTKSIEVFYDFSEPGNRELILIYHDLYIGRIYVQVAASKMPPEPPIPMYSPPESTPTPTVDVCTVSFNAGTGEGNYKTLTRDSGGILSLTNACTNAFVRKGYVFACFVDQNGNKFYAGDMLIVTESLQLTAEFTKVTVAKVSAPRLSKESGKIRVRYAKVTKASGYQFTISASSSFVTGKTGSKTCKGYTKNYIQTCAGKALKQGTNYYVKVRAYKLDSTGVKVWGAYSTVAKIRF